MEEEFVLLEKWYVKATKENIDTLSEWRFGDTNNKVWENDIVGMYYSNTFNRLEKGHNPSTLIKDDSINGYNFGIEITFEQFKKHVLKMEEKKIIGYKLNGKVDRKTIDGFLNYSMPYHGEKAAIYQSEEEKSHYFVVGHLGGSLVKKCKDAGVLDLWFEPVYEPEKPKEEIISMGSFSLKVTKEGIFHKNENITSFVTSLKNIMHENFGFSKKRGNGNWDSIVKDIIFSKTGCENSETKASDWLKVWDKYQEFQK